MKKEWTQPVLEVLEVTMTMGGSTGDQLDATFPVGTPRGDLTFS